MNYGSGRARLALTLQTFTSMQKRGWDSSFSQFREGLAEKKDSRIDLEA